MPQSCIAEAVRVRLSKSARTPVAALYPLTVKHLSVDVCWPMYPHHEGTQRTFGMTSKIQLRGIVTSDCTRVW